ncbi:hypothetical protein [Nostoc sp.]|uniref:hypothetical protein n=1 Tax=Nostoc sp. TaxID=1180 RepID=UPI002FF8DECF
MSPSTLGLLPALPLVTPKPKGGRIKEKILQKNEMTVFLIRVDYEAGKRGAEKD